ncbi:MAG: class I adenylate-forming enzyme family protein [Candidatus Hodarchaeota archaeon]
MSWLNMGEMLHVNAHKFPNKMALKDAKGEVTFQELDLRTNRLANALLNLGLNPQDRFAALCHNHIEYMEIYLAAAKAGLVVVPVSFRLVGKEIEYIIDNSESKAIVVDERYVPTMRAFRSELSLAFRSKLPKMNHVAIGSGNYSDFLNYEKIIAKAADSPPEVSVKPDDTWIQLYTSGTTGIPKGVVRSHRSYISFFLINEVEFGFRYDDYGLVLMPLFHVNSTFYSFVFTYIGASCYIHRSIKFDAEELLQIIDKEKITYTSLIPTHYHLILSLPEEIKQKYDVSSIKQLLTSSAPATKQMKLDVMQFFPNAALFEAYGSTEAGLVTILRPEDQMKKLGSIGRECVGTDIIKILDEKGNPVPQGEVGELYSRGPMMFDHYWKLADKTTESFQGEWFSAGDMARVDEEGYYYLVDRKANMIITGGEHVYPSELEELLCMHPKILETAVIGIPHPKWGEAVRAIIVLKERETATEEEIINWCRGKIAGYKRPKSVVFISHEEMPRTASGKIMHKGCRDQYSD